MTKFFELLDKKGADAIAKGSIKIGNVYRIEMDETNGIKPKNGDASRNKFFVVLGFDENGDAYGGVIINSIINPRIPQSVRDWHMPIKCEKYSFLEHDSFVDCSKLKQVNPGKFGKWKFLGVITLEDVQMIIATVQGSPNETKAHLAMFGL